MYERIAIAMMIVMLRNSAFLDKPAIKGQENMGSSLLFWGKLRKLLPSP